MRPDDYKSTTAHIGKRLRTARCSRGLNQVDLAKHMGASFQQLQKYETGHNRVSATTLWILARALNVPIDYFFRGLEGASDQSIQANSAIEVEVLRLLRASHPEVQRSILAILSAANQPSMPIAAE